MRGIYEIVSLSTTLKDVSFIFQRHNGYIGLNTRHKLSMRYIHMMDDIWEHGRRHTTSPHHLTFIKGSIYFSIRYIKNEYEFYKKILIIL